MSHEETSLVKHRSGTLVLRGEDGEARSISFPGKMADVMAIEALTQIRGLEIKKTVGKATEELYEMVIRPDLKRGLASGKYVMFEGSVEIRNAKTMKIVGKATMQKADPKSLLTQKSFSPVSSVAGAICTTAIRNPRPGGRG